MASGHSRSHDDDQRYFGERNERGRKHGQGTYYLNTGDYYIGNWRKGRMEGQGKYVHAKGDRVDEGWFYKNKYMGQEPNRKLRRKINRGLIPDTSSSDTSAGDGGRDERYVGNYKSGKPDGEGAYFYPDGSFYKGNWRKGRKEGKGRLVDSNGEGLTGWFYKNNYVGEQPNKELLKKIKRGMIPNPDAETSHWSEGSDDSDSDVDNRGGVDGFLESTRKLVDHQAERHV